MTGRHVVGHMLLVSCALLPAVLAGGDASGPVYLAGTCADPNATQADCTKKELALGSNFDSVDAKSCEKTYGRYLLFTIDDPVMCQEAIGNDTVYITNVSDSTLPPGCGYFNHPLLGGAVVYYNKYNKSSVYCDPSISICICRKERRSVEIGTNFLYLMLAFIGFVGILALLTWFNCVRISKYERERIKQIKAKLAEQIGPGGAASTLALKPFGNDCVSLTWRFGTTEGDCIEEYKRQYREQHPGIIQGITRPKPQWGTQGATDGSWKSQKSEPLATRVDMPEDSSLINMDGGNLDSTAPRDGQYVDMNGSSPNVPEVDV